MEVGKSCDPRVKTEWQNLTHAKRACAIDSDCTMFWESCRRTFLYCRTTEISENLEDCNCCKLYRKGNIAMMYTFLESVIKSC